MHVDDLANSCIYFLKNNTSNYLLNIGSGEEHSIKVFANKISKIIGYDGNIVFNKRFPDGTPRKVLDSSLANSLGWKSKILFDQEIQYIYDNFKKNK